NGALTLPELDTRVQKAEAALLAAHNALDALVKRGTSAIAGSLRTALLKLAGFGLAPAIPSMAAGDDATTLATSSQQPAALLADSRQRLDRGTTLRTQAVATDPRARRDQLVERIHAVFGTAFVVLPRFTCAAAAATEIASAIGA